MSKWFFRALGVFWGMTMLFSPAAKATAISTQTQEGRAMNGYDFSFERIDGSGPLSLSDFKGKVLLIVNTASRCGFTKQYEGLQHLHDGFADQGLIVIGVPSNDFMGQEPGTNAEIQKFCETTFGISFPMAKKVSVKGGEAHPFYRWAATQPKGDVPGWNFHKFLVDRGGVLIGSFGSSTRPDDADFIDAIEQALKQPAP